MIATVDSNSKNTALIEKNQLCRSFGFSADDNTSMKIYNYYNKFGNVQSGLMKCLDSTLTTSNGNKGLITCLDSKGNPVTECCPVHVSSSNIIVNGKHKDSIERKISCPTKPKLCKDFITCHNGGIPYEDPTVPGIFPDNCKCQCQPTAPYGPYCCNPYQLGEDCKVKTGCVTVKNKFVPYDATGPDRIEADNNRCKDRFAHDSTLLMGKNDEGNYYYAHYATDRYGTPNTLLANPRDTDPTRHNWLQFHKLSGGDGAEDGGRYLISRAVKSPDELKGNVWCIGGHKTAYNKNFIYCDQPPPMGKRLEGIGPYIFGEKNASQAGVPKDPKYASNDGIPKGKIWWYRYNNTDRKPFRNFPNYDYTELSTEYTGNDDFYWTFGTFPH
jgi:hypothetical protein